MHWLPDIEECKGTPASLRWIMTRVFQQGTQHNQQAVILFKGNEGFKIEQRWLYNMRGAFIPAF